jgi:hypothetical protein
MFLTPLLSSIESSAEIRSYFDWHKNQKRALLLLSAASDGPSPAFVQSIDPPNTRVEVMCTGMRAVGANSNVPYAVIGSSPSGANFLASGQMHAIAGTSDCFSLSFPQWIDVSQSRDSYRCLAPGGHFLHFCSVDPHLNDVICRVHNISLGGLAVEWALNNGPAPELGSVIDNTILHARENKVHLGSLRVAHISPLGRNCLVGLHFEQDTPRSFDAMVLDAQRAEYLLLAKH